MDSGFIMLLTPSGPSYDEFLVISEVYSVVESFLCYSGAGSRQSCLRVF